MPQPAATLSRRAPISPVQCQAPLKSLTSGPGRDQKVGSNYTRVSEPLRGKHIKTVRMEGTLQLQVRAEQRQVGWGCPAESCGGTTADAVALAHLSAMLFIALNPFLMLQY